MCGLGEIREEEEPNFMESRSQYIEFLKNPGLKKKRNNDFVLGSEYVKPSEETQERFEDLCQFITTTEKQHEGN